MLKQLADKVLLVTNATFTGRVAMAAVVIALEVITEPMDTYARPLRVNFASAILGDPMRQGTRLAAVVVSDGALAVLALVSNPTAIEVENLDTAIIERLRMTWNAMSGVTDVKPVVVP